jgi:hypothetical protein
MAAVQIADVIVPEIFTAYQIENSFVSNAFYQSGVALPNGVIQDQLSAGATQFTVPIWNDLADVEPNYSTDNPAVFSTPNKIGAYSLNVRKTFANNSWSTMDLAAELSGSDPLARIQSRVEAYWSRQMQLRLIASLQGILMANVANNSSDMVVDITAGTGTAANFNATSVINTAETLGDRLEDVKTIAMHSHVYTQALINDEVQFIPNSEGQPIKTYRGMAVVIDDGLILSTGNYLSVLFGAGAVGYGVSEPRSSLGTELWRVPSAGNGGGQTQLYSRMNIAMAPVGYSWSDGTGASAIAGESPTLADLALPAHWTRATSQRKAIPLAFLISK